MLVRETNRNTENNATFIKKSSIKPTMLKKEELCLVPASTFQYSYLVGYVVLLDKESFIF